MIPFHPLTNFETQKHCKKQKLCKNEPRFNGAYSRDNLTDKIKDEEYIINLDEYSDVKTHWIALYTINNNITYFDNFGVDHIIKEI